VVCTVHDGNKPWNVYAVWRILFSLHLAKFSQESGEVSKLCANVRHHKILSPSFEVFFIRIAPACWCRKTKTPFTRIVKHVSNEKISFVTVRNRTRWSLIYTSGFHRGATTRRGVVICEPFLEGSRVDILSTQL